MANLLCSAHDTVLPSPLYQAPREKTIILEGWVTMEADVEAARLALATRGAGGVLGLVPA